MNINWEKRILLDVRAIIHKKRIKVIIAEKRSLALCSALSQSDQEMQSNSSKNPNALFLLVGYFWFHYNNICRLNQTWWNLLLLLYPGSWNVKTPRRSVSIYDPFRCIGYNFFSLLCPFFTRAFVGWKRDPPDMHFPIWKGFKRDLPFSLSFHLWTMCTHLWCCGIKALSLCGVRTSPVHNTILSC